MRVQPSDIPLKMGTEQNLNFLMCSSLDRPSPANSHVVESYAIANSKSWSTQLTFRYAGIFYYKSILVVSTLKIVTEGSSLPFFGCSTSDCVRGQTSGI